MPLEVTRPEIGYFPCGLDSAIVPVNRDRVCVQRRVNLPATAPLYFPDQVPLRCSVALRLFAAVTLPASASRPRIEAAAATGIRRRRRWRCIAGASLSVRCVVLRASLRRPRRRRKAGTPYEIGRPLLW